MTFTKFAVQHQCTLSLATAIGLAACFSIEAAASDIDQENPIAAETGQGSDTWQRLHDWEVIIGAGAMYAPKFEGSDQFEILPLPMFMANFGDRVSIDPFGLTVDVWEAHDFKLSVKGGYEMGRDEDDSNHLEGLGDVDFGGVIGAQVSYGFGPAEVYASVDKTIGGSEGLIGKFGAKAFLPYGSFMFSADAYGTLADDNHMESYFGVTQSQSLLSGLSEYDASAGLKRADVEVSVMYMVTEHWLVRGQAGVGILLGDAADSPIVQEEIQPSVMLMLGYKF